MGMYLVTLFMWVSSATRQSKKLHIQNFSFAYNRKYSNVLSVVSHCKTVRMASSAGLFVHSHDDFSPVRANCNYFAIIALLGVHLDQILTD
jgi:hypothetical protein